MGNGNFNLDDLEQSLISGEHNRDWRSRLKNRPAGTQRAYGSRLEKFDAYLKERFPDADPEEPTDQHCAMFLIHEFRRGLGASVLRLSVTALRWRAKVIDHPSPIGDRTQSTLKTLVRQSRIQGRGKGQATSLSEAEIHRLFRQVESAVAPWGIRDGALVAVTYYGTLRASESLALEMSDLQMLPNGEAQIRIRHTKTGKGRDVTLIPAAAKKLRCWIEFSGIKSGPIFRRIQRMPFGDYFIDDAGLTYYRFHQLIAYRAKQAGLGSVSTHTLRRSHTRALMEKGATDTELQLVGGWRDPAMVARYAGHPGGQANVVRKFYGTPALKVAR